MNRSAFFANVLLAFMLYACGTDNSRSNQNSANDEAGNTLTDSIDVYETDSSIQSIEITQVEVVTSISDYDTVYPSDMIPNDSVYPYLIITPGVYHNDEADESWAQKKWFCVFEYDEYEVYSKKSNLVLKNTVDGLLDDDGEMTAWSVAFEDSTDRCLFAFSGFKMRQRKPLHSLLIKPTNLLPGDTIALEYHGTKYVLYATGHRPHNKLNPSFVEVSNYRMWLHSATTDQLLFSATRFSDAMPEVLFIGDIDSDNKLDFIINATPHYNAYMPTLYLSSEAHPKELVKCVAQHTALGC